ncbi:FYVE zinc finger-domain-containing protein [Macrophomina phaseolina]|uniref:FYVE zinc finger-domain-containing protein n=1 Tax=Macrophomina phaseolina TaxID=35725 RepID=A0ABQ8GCV7_9PEZI|nr:FYVE zinc finger-domain-containing protein [Macrophomina phaseolina]
MTSRPGRSLGGGRTLGSAKALSPAADPRPTHHHRNSSLLSPSESSVSLASQSSVSPASTADPESLTARVSLEHADNVAAASASSRLVCPICNEEMMTLLQLNRHLDDLHQNLEEVEQDEIQTWFRTQMVKAKKFQPLAVLNQKLKGLDVFESNDSPFLPAPTPQSSAQAHHELSRPLDPEELVTRTHWQWPSYSDPCSEPICGKRLGAANGSVNCRKCGRLFCEEHTMYQMKLSRSAQHEPVRGIWCRVCETCYKSREGYNDHNGAERNHTAAFTAIRRKHVDKANLDIGRLEKRLTKLTQLLADPPPPEPQSGAGSLIWPLSGAKAQQRALEQSIIAWEDDASVLQCPFCQQEFTSYSFRRHHCRLCGRVVCGDPKTGCSTEVGLSVAAPANSTSEKSQGQVNVDVRMCRDCKHTLFSKSDFAREVSEKPRDARAYENLVQFERGIRLLLPRFQKLLAALQDPEHPPSPTQLQDATKVRKRLMDAFAQYDTAARRIRDFPTDSPTQTRLQKAVYQQAYNFLSLHMLPLKSLPRILKHASPNGAQSKSNGRPNGALAAIKYNDIENSSVASSSSAISTMEAEEKELRERLIVLEEQKFFVQEMIADANRRRKFDEVSSLALNVEDLSKEIDQINGQLNQLDFAAAYSGDMFPQN